jgi:DNA-binding LacI/PurR family transcriptional regulator
LSTTIKDIAKAADVSHTTVSRALRGHPAIADTTVARIRKLAKEMGYVPSAAARSLKTNRSNVIAAIVHRAADPFCGEVLDGVQDVLQDQAYNLFLTSPGKRNDNEDAAIRALIEHRIEGMIICATFVSQESYARLEDAGIPVVMVHNRASEETRFSLYHDDIYGGKTVVKHLIELGHHRIAYIANSRSGRSNVERLAGYRQALSEAGIRTTEAYVVDTVDDDFASGYEAARQLFENNPPPSAIFGFNDLIAIGAIQALRDMHLSVPDECSVVGFDNIAFSSLVTPTLTTFDQPKYTLGVNAAHMLLKLLAHNGPDLPAEKVVLRGRLLERDSSAFNSTLE